MKAQRPADLNGADPQERLTTLAAVVERQQREIEELRDRQAAREIVCLAEGVLVERLHCTPAEAAAYLRDLAARTGVKAVELAADLIGEPVGAGRLRFADGEAGPRPARPPEVPDEPAGERRELGDALLAQVLQLAGAAAAGLWQLQPDGALEFVAGSGLSALETSRWRRIPPQLDSFAQRVAERGQPLWLAGSLPVAERPLSPWAGGARAVLPVRGPAALLGVLEVVWSGEEHTVPPSVRRRLTTLADVTAHVLASSFVAGGRTPSGRPENAWLGAVLDDGLLVQPLPGVRGEPVDFEITHVAAGFTDPAGRTHRQLAGLSLVRAYPMLAAYGIVDRAAEVLRTGVPCRLERIPSSATGEAAGAAEVTVRIVPFLDGLLVDWRPGTDADQLASLLSDIQRLGGLGGWEHSLVTGETTWTDQTFVLFGIARSEGAVGWTDLIAKVHPEDTPIVEHFQATLLHRRPVTATFRLIRPEGTVRQVRAHGEPIVADNGALVAVRGIYQDLSAQYHSQVALAATQDRLADTEQRARQQYRIVRELQHAIMPVAAGPVHVAGLDIAVRYRPAESEHAVGGDWYDVVALPGDQALLVIGDVAGHGIDAAQGMVALRNALRGLACTGAGPGQLLAWLNATTFTNGRINGTVLCGLYDPAARRLRWARAGHLPPVLVRDGGADVLAEPHGMMLGADPDAAFEETTTVLREGDTLVLYTDGLIERRGVLLDESLDRLARVAAEGDSDVERFSDRLLGHATADTDDDTCLIVIRVPGGPRR
ncbi:SpoIIE family protein phosphatase [Prauserella endophytica]|uniref:ANTAR domain-containing protein n=1 Tax=Prauserella endophytica TaxID=1592324 RepID=A0ABY2SB96_9PSEU|nr:SpoIIE family protein phosphatase [Prauserella endophytica]TKG72966.1 ANTAR domain-containing protein [Prauserella endophytica]